MAQHRSDGENNPSRGRRTQERATNRSELKTIKKSDKDAAHAAMRLGIKRLKKS